MRECPQDVDWELLAEHLDGALTGTPEGTQVAHLVATDPRWAGAASQLTAALDAVEADLRAMPPVPPLPDDVAARLDAALAALPPGGGSPEPATRPSAPAPRDGRPPRGPAHTGAGHTGAGHTGPAHTGPGHTGPGGRQARRRRMRWGAGIAVTGAVVAFAAVGLGPLGLLDSQGFTGATAADDADTGAEHADAPEAAADGERPTMTASGTNYQPGSPLFTTRSMPLAPGQAPAPADRTLTDSGEDAEELALAPDPPLDRLWADPLPCLAEVTAIHEPAPAQVAQADFATFENQPAVVIWVTTADGAEWVLVVGPDCGIPAAGPDELHRIQLR